MKLALSEVRALNPAEVKSAVSFKTGPYTPDFHAFEIHDPPSCAGERPSDLSSA